VGESFCRYGSRALRSVREWLWEATLCHASLYSEFNETGDRFANMFVSHRQTFLINLKEAGQSPRVEDESELDMEEAVEDLEVIRQSGFEVWDFAGHSTGGMLGLLYATQHGESLGALIVVGAAASKDYTSKPDCIYHPEHPKFQRMQELRGLQLQDGIISPEQKSQYAKEITKLSLFVPDNYDAYFSGNVRKNVAPKRLEHFSRVDFPKSELTSSLRNVTVRSLVMCGLHDVLCPLRCLVDIHENMPNSQLVVFDDSNHYPFLEEEAIFSKHVESFLQE